MPGDAFTDDDKPAPPLALLGRFADPCPGVILGLEEALGSEFVIPGMGLAPEFGMGGKSPLAAEFNEAALAVGAGRWLMATLDAAGASASGSA